MTIPVENKRGESAFRFFDNEKLLLVDADYNALALITVEKNRQFSLTGEKILWNVKNADILLLYKKQHMLSRSGKECTLDNKEAAPRLMLVSEVSYDCGAFFMRETNGFITADVLLPLQMGKQLF